MPGLLMESNWRRMVGRPAGCVLVLLAMFSASCAQGPTAGQIDRFCGAYADATELLVRDAPTLFGPDGNGGTPEEIDRLVRELRKAWKKVADVAPTPEVRDAAEAAGKAMDPASGSDAGLPTPNALDEYASRNCADNGR